MPIRRREPSINSVWMKPPCWRDISCRPVHGILQKQNTPPNRADYRSWRPLSNCPQVGVKYVCLSVCQPTSTSAAVGIVLYSRHCSVLNIGRENCRPDSPTSTKHFSVHGPTRPACDSLSHGATSVPDPEISFRFQQPNHSFLSSDLSCQTCQVGWAGRPVSPRNLPVSILQVLFQRIIYLF